MQYLYIDTMGEEDYQKYLDKLSTLDVEQELTVVIHTNGGDNELCDILSEELSKFTLHIKAYAVQSAGMILLDRLYQQAKSVKVCEYSIYMVHIPAREIYIGFGGVTSRGGLEKHCSKLMKIAKPHKFNILTEKEQERYIKGKDIYIMPQRIKDYYTK